MLIFLMSECNQGETCRTQLNCTEAVMLVSTHSLNVTDAPFHNLATPFLLPRPSPESTQQLPLFLASDGEQKVCCKCHLSLQRFKSTYLTLIFWKMYTKFGQHSLSSPSHMNVPKIQTYFQKWTNAYADLENYIANPSISANINRNPTRACRAAFHAPKPKLIDKVLHLNCQQALTSPDLPTKKSQPQGCWRCSQCVYET